MLASFYYIWKKKKGKGYDYMEKQFSTYGRNIRFFMDSGAYTLQQDVQDITDEEIEAFLNDYIYAMKQWRKHIECYVELDLDVLMGLKWTKYARKRLVNEIGLDPIIVHHTETRTFAEYKSECARYKYVGFSIGEGDLFTSSRFMKYYLTAQRYKTRLHAFGITQPFILLKHHFYSCDSLSWSMGAKFGTTFENKRGRMLRHNNYEKRIRRKLVTQLQTYGIPVIDVLNDKYIAVDRWNVMAWMLCEIDINKRWGKPYWGDPMEGQNEMPDKIGLRSKIFDQYGNLVNPVPLTTVSKKRVVNLRSFLSRGGVKRKNFKKGK